MNWTIHEDGIVRKTGQSACFLPTEAEKEFWARIQELESVIRKFLNYTRTGNNVNTYVPNWQIEELAEFLNPPQQ